MANESHSASTDGGVRPGSELATAPKRRFWKTSQSSFKSLHSKFARMAESQKIKARYPDRIPVIVERATGFGCGDAPPIDKNKFLIPANLTVGQLVLVIRRRIGMAAADAVFVFVSTGSDADKRLTLPPTSVTLAEVYEQSKDDDGFLYVKYAGENVFGGGGDVAKPYGKKQMQSPRPARSGVPLSSLLLPPPPIALQCAYTTPAPSAPSTPTDTKRRQQHSECISTKPSVARRLRAAVSTKLAKRKATKEAKLSQAGSSSGAISGSFVQRPEQRGGTDKSSGGAVAIKYRRFPLSKAERDENKRLRRPMLRSQPADYGPGSFSKYRNYGTMPYIDRDSVASG